MVEEKNMEQEVVEEEVFTPEDIEKNKTMAGLAYLSSSYR